MGVLPDVEEGEGPVDRDGDEREEEPESGEGFGVVDVAPEGIDDEAEQQPEIDAEAAGADGELKACEIERAFRDLVAEEAEKIVER